MEFWLGSSLLVLATFIVFVIARRRLTGRGAISEDVIQLSRVSNAVVAALELQSMLFGHKAGTAPIAEAGDDWSNGYIQGFARCVIEKAGRFDEISTAAAVVN